MSSALVQHLEQRLAQHQAENLMRHRMPCSALDTPYVKQDNQTFLNFTSNDYLGFSQHPAIIQSLQQHAAHHGLSALGSSLAQGHTHAHQQLEENIAQWLNYPRALIFTSGYMAVLAAITALIGPNDFVAIDRQCHASVYDAVQLSQAAWQRYHDHDLSRLEKLLENNRAPFAFIITSGVFSMQGHIAPLIKLAELAKRFNATLIVDDVHATGVLGEQGQGSIAHLGLDTNDVPVMIGSLSKGLGTMGAFIAGQELLIENIVQFARPYMFSTALPSALAAASITAIDLTKQAQAARTHLQQLTRYFQQHAQDLKWPLLASNTPIQALVFPDIEHMQMLEKKLRADNILVSLIRPPTVAKDAPRIRITLSASHQMNDVDRLITGLKK